MAGLDGVQDGRVLYIRLLPLVILRHVAKRGHLQHPLMADLALHRLWSA